MSKQLIVRPYEGELKVYTPEAEKEWSSIKRSEVLDEIKKEIKSLGVNTKTGGGESSIKQSEIERIVEEKIKLMKVKRGTEDVGHTNGDMRIKNDLGGRIIEEDII
jgi:hypothetical protein